MLRQTSTAVLTVLAALVSSAMATAQEPKPAGAAGELSPKQITNSIGMKLTLVPSGEFMMGSKEPAKETYAFFNENYGHMFQELPYIYDYEHPQHRVRITTPFYMGTHHVTRGQFRHFVKECGYKTDAENGDPPSDLGGADGWNGFNKDNSWRKVDFEQTDEHPVVNVSWNDAVAFCDWLSKKDGKSYRLPTEAEWEYACRAGTTTRYYCGDDPESLASVANVADATARIKFPNWKYTIKASDGYVFTSPVGKFKPNCFGLYDMHGNACQWCADWHGEDYYGKSPEHDPTGPGTGDFRVVRGGSWYYGPCEARSASRGARSPNDRSDLVGFRVARTQ
jgi:formylglycine-generating enzyme required for sulfatase activity